jgi:hypothetical protein
MSLAIDIDAVTSVLVGGHWFNVEQNEDGESTFDVDSYEYMDADLWDMRMREGGSGRDAMRLAGGQYESCGIPATGFGFKDKDTGGWVYGPLTSIQAVVTDPEMTRRLRALASTAV